MFDRLEQEIQASGYLIGHRLTLADMYLFVLGRWGLRLAKPTPANPKLWRFTERLAGVGPVQRALVREGIALHGPAGGLG